MPESSTASNVGRVVVMGVAGAGKTTVGSALAEQWGSAFVDADDVHPPANVAKMAAGQPLDDDDRRPWLAALRGRLAAASSIVVTCSALKRSYRDVLREAGDVRFVLLDVDPATAQHRASERDDHFMGADMVVSQFEALDPPSLDETDVLVVDATTALAEVVDSIDTALG